MIRLTRVRTTTAIPKQFRGVGRVATSRALIDLVRRGDPPLSSVWKKAKKQLKAESFGKCAYCESSTDTVAHGDVEHFRPKSEYWWLAYCFDNYTFACQICNQSYKGSNFPRSGTGLTAPELAESFTDAALGAMAEGLCPDPLDEASLSAHNVALAKERAHLPDPYAVDPEPLFAWVADSVLKEVEVKARSTRVASKRAFAAAVDFLGLNRDELMRRRYKVYEVAKAFVDVLAATDVPTSVRDLATEQLKKLMHESAEYAGMVRYFVNVEWKLDIEP